MQQSSLPALVMLDSAQKRALLKRLIRRQRSELQQQVPMTSGQAAMYLLQKDAPTNRDFNIFAAIQIRGALDVARVRRAIHKLAQLHPVLNARCTENMHLNIVPGNLKLEEQEVAVLPERFTAQQAAAVGFGRIAARLAAYAETSGLESFDLHESLARVTLLRPDVQGTDGSAVQILVFCTHHIVADYWSMNLLINDFWRLYAEKEFASSSPQAGSGAMSSAALPAPQTAFAAYADEETFGRSDAAGAARSFWQEYLKNAAPTSNLPVRRPRPAVRDVDGAARKIVFDQDFSADIMRCAREHNITLYELLLAAWGLVLRQTCQLEDITIGSPVNIRSLAERRNAVGYFVNMLAMRLRPTAGLHLDQYLQNVKETVAAALRHRHLPFSEIVALAKYPRSAAFTPAFQSALTLQSLPSEGVMRELSLAQSDGLTFADLELCLQEGALQPGQFDLALELCVYENTIAGYLKYNAAAFSNRQIEELRHALQACVRLCCLSSNPKLEDIDVYKNLSGNPYLDGNFAPEFSEPAVQPSAAAIDALQLNSRDYLAALLAIKNAGLPPLQNLGNICLSGEYPSQNTLRLHFELFSDTALHFVLRAKEELVAWRTFEAADIRKFEMPKLRAADRYDLFVLGKNGHRVPDGSIGVLHAQRRESNGGDRIDTFEDLGRLRARRLENGMIEILGPDRNLHCDGIEFDVNEICVAAEQHPAVAWAEIKTSPLNDSANDADSIGPVASLGLGITVPQNRIAPDLQSMRQFLRARIPAFMLPDALAVADLNRSGLSDTVKLITSSADADRTDTVDVEEGEI